MVMVHPTRRSGAGEDRFSRVLRPGATGVAQGRRSVMAHTISLDGRSLPRYGHRRASAGSDLGDDAGGHRGLDDVVAAVGLAGDLVQGLHVDGQDATPDAQLPNAAGKAVSGPDQTQNAATEMANKPRRAPKTDELLSGPFPRETRRGAAA